MNYRILFIFLFLLSCKTIDSNNVKKEIIFEKSFSNKGFALIFNDKVKKKEKIIKSLNKKSLVVYQRNLKKNTIVKITNLNNNKSIMAKVGDNVKYPLFYNSVLSQRISDIIDLDINEPYIEIKKIKNDSTFIAGKAKTFDEEKKVANKAPVEGITIKKIGINKKKVSKKIIKKEFNYIIKIADFYFYDTAKLLKNRIYNEIKINDVNINELSKTKFRVYLGPYKNLNSLRKAFIKALRLDFENIEIVKL